MEEQAVGKEEQNRKEVDEVLLSLPINLPISLQASGSIQSKSPLSLKVPHEQIYVSDG